MEKKIIANVNPMQETTVKIMNSSLTVSAVGGFITKLQLKGINLLYFDKVEHQAAIAGKAHYGAPFLCPPGINAGYDRHGSWRKLVWKMFDNNEDVQLEAINNALKIMQNIHLEQDNLRVNINVENLIQKEVPCELGLHYYWDLLPQDIDFGDQLLGYRAWDNLQNKWIERVDKNILNANQGIDLHVVSGKPILSFYYKPKNVTVRLGFFTPGIEENNTWVLYREANSLFYAIEAWSAPQGTNGRKENGAYFIPPKENAFYEFSVDIFTGNIL